MAMPECRVGQKAAYVPEAGDDESGLSASQEGLPETSSTHS